MPDSLPIQVLVVDNVAADFAIIRDLLREITGVAYHIDWAKDYESGLQAAQSHRYDVFLVNYALGFHTGLDFLRAVQNHDCQVPVVLLTSSESYDVDVEATVAGAADYLLKTHINALLLERSIRYAIERKRAEADLRRRIEQQQLLATLSTRFSNLPADQLDEEINNALQMLGEFAHAGRCYVFQFENGDINTSRLFSNTYEWCAQGVSQQIEHLQELPLAHFPWLCRHLQKRENIIVRDVSAMPDVARAEQKEFRLQHICALILVPIQYEGQACGFIGLDELTGARNWPEDVLVLLRMIGEMIAMVIHRARDEAALERAVAENNRLATAINKSSISVIITDPHLPNNPAIFVNTAFTTITGYEPEEALGRNCNFLIGNKTDAGEIANMNQAIREERDYQGVILNYRKDGTTFWNELIVSPVCDDEGRLVNFIGLQNDVTARIESQIALANSEARLARIAANVPGMLYQFLLKPDGSMSFLYVSQSCQEIYGIAPEQLMDDVSLGLSIVHPDYIESFHCSLKDSARTLRPWLWEGCFCHPSGEDKWVRSASRPQRQPNGDVLWDGLLTDITAEKQAGEQLRQSRAALQYANNELEVRVGERTLDLQRANDALRESEQLYRTLAHNFPEGALFLFDHECRHRIVGGSALSELGYKAHEMEGRRMHEVLPAPLIAQLSPIYLEVLQGHSHVFDLHLENRTFSIHTLPVRNESGDVYAGMVAALDVTGHKQAELDLQTAKEEAECQREIAEQANHAKSEFLSRMSHELRTPLNSILGFGQLLERSELPENQKKRAALIVTAGHHLLKLINEVLNIAQIEAGHISYSLEAVQIEGIVQEVVSLMQPLAARRAITITLHVFDEREHFILADRQRFKQVLLNLLGNAIKYNREGGQIILTCTSSENQVFLTVRDTGPGISAEFIERLFLPFERLGAEYGEIEGTGLGLPLSQRLMEAMNGRIEVTSEVGSGSTFTLQLPAAQPPQRFLPSSDAAGPPQKWCDAELRHILYIEDNLANLELIENIFSELLPFKLLAAMQGRIGLELAGDHPPDLVLLDLHLPDMSGQEVLKILKADPALAAIPVIALSADATPDQIQRIMQLGAAEYLTKPIDIEQFLQVVNRIFKGTNRGR